MDKKSPGVRFYARLFEFKSDSLNQKYLKRLRTSSKEVEPGLMLPINSIETDNLYSQNP